MQHTPTEVLRIYHLFGKDIAGRSEWSREAKVGFRRLLRSVI